MLTTHVIILAQGNQRRLGDSVTGPKCLLELPAIGTSILRRTLTQVWKMLGGVGLNEEGLGPNDHYVTVVSWHEVRRYFDLLPVKIPPTSGNPFVFRPEVESLADPGNSSLKGIARYLVQCSGVASIRRPMLRDERWPERTIVLLGDVVYSWRCMESLFTTNIETNMLFAGTHDLGPGGGELWGIRWDRSADPLMMSTLESALAKHPRFEEYQPGQLRNWLWEVDRRGQDWPWGTRPVHRAWFCAVDDYTMDVDLPEHVPLLPEASSRAYVDDKEHGVTW